LAFLEDKDSRFAVTAERAALGALGGGCQVPIGIHCGRRDSEWFITGVVATPDGSGVVREELERQSDADPQALGEKLARKLIEQGAGELLRASLP
jgi:hydroxymethylbilane synthase